jgi:iron complex transport system ATP-binding protein
LAFIEKKDHYRMNKINYNKLQVEALFVGYDKTNPLCTDLNFSFSPGLTGIIGINGIGKSTLLKTIAGLIPPLQGKILINGHDCTKLTVENKAQLISVVLTEKIDDTYITAEEITASGRSPYTGWNGKLSQADKKLVLEAMEKCGIIHLKHRRFLSLSDGEKQRCLIARALSQSTPLMILDEPTSFLDFKARYEILDLLKTVSKEDEKIILFSSHDIELVFKSTDNCLVFQEQNKVIMMDTAHLIQSDIPHQLLKNSRLKFDPNTCSIHLPS